MVESQKNTNLENTVRKISYQPNDVKHRKYNYTIVKLDYQYLLFKASYYVLLFRSRRGILLLFLPFLLWNHLIWTKLSWWRG